MCRGQHARRARRRGSKPETYIACMQAPKERSITIPSQATNCNRHYQALVRQGVPAPVTGHQMDLDVPGGYCLTIRITAPFPSLPLLPRLLSICDSRANHVPRTHDISPSPSQDSQSDKQSRNDSVQPTTRPRSSRSTRERHVSSIFALFIGQVLPSHPAPRAASWSHGTADGRPPRHEEGWANR